MSRKPISAEILPMSPTSTSNIEQADILGLFVLALSRKYKWSVRQTRTSDAM